MIAENIEWWKNWSI